MTKLETVVYSVWFACQVAHYRRKGDVLNALGLLRAAKRSNNPRVVKLAQYGIDYRSVTCPDSQVLTLRKDDKS